jgi:hypothetical protein
MECSQRRQQRVNERGNERCFVDFRCCETTPLKYLCTIATEHCTGHSGTGMDGNMCVEHICEGSAMVAHTRHVESGVVSGMFWYTQILLMCFTGTHSHTLYHSYSTLYTPTVALEWV